MIINSIPNMPIRPPPANPPAIPKLKFGVPPPGNPPGAMNPPPPQ